MKISKSLNKISTHYQAGNEFDQILTAYEMNTIKANFMGNKFLELGCSTGDSTAELLKYAKSIDIIEGSDKIIKVAKQRFDQLKNNRVTVRFFNQLWEDYSFNQEYSDVFWIRGIEHIKNPLPILKKIANTLKKSNGRIHVITVNANSLNRRIGVYMNLLKSPYDLSARDKKFGHYKIYDRSQLSKLMVKAGFEIISCNGIMLKPLPNDQMYKLYKKNPALIKAFYDISGELPDYCSEIYIYAKPQ